jgi:hypothetical protein
LPSSAAQEEMSIKTDLSKNIKWITLSEPH